MSHVLNWRSTVNGMLRGAVDVLSPEGVLLIILHAIDGSEWERLLRVMMMPRALQPDLTLTVKRWLSSRGFSVRQRRITTVVRAETDVCLIEALSFVAGENDEGTANTFALRLAESNLVSQQYRTDDGEYVFEFGHLLLCAMRAGERG
jgi:hypothetical protein